MHSPKQIDPPVQWKPSGIGEPVIAVHISVVPGPANLIFYPEQNRIATDLLCRLLQARLELAGVCATDVKWGLPFNRSLITFTVSALAPAQEAIKAELELLGLFDCAQIAWFDAREGAWRLLYSQSGRRFEPPSDEEFAAERGFFAEIIDGLENF